MAKAKPKRKKSEPAKPETREESELGRTLRKLAEEYRKSGGRLLRTRREIEREVIRLRTDC